MLHSEERDTTDSISYIFLPEAKTQFLIGMNPSYPEIDKRVIHQADCTFFYGDDKRLYLTMFVLRAFVDSDHANDKVRWRSPDGILFLHQYGLHDLVYKETGNCGKCSFGA